MYRALVRPFVRLTLALSRPFVRLTFEKEGFTQEVRALARLYSVQVGPYYGPYFWSKALLQKSKAYIGFY